MSALDFEDAEETILELFDVTQQGIIVQGAENAAEVVYKLGKNSEQAERLSKIKDPVKFAFAVAKLENDKVKNRKAPPPPEKTVVSSGPKSGVVDSELERLREEAARTGNYTKVTQYKRKKNKA